ncbi:MAG TPA: PHB depolymerase family esterase [Mycobacteriales bacterium]|nr:PHB depolymerase family esterase [Mycobacteriales bacterium]
MATLDRSRPLRRALVILSALGLLAVVAGCAPGRAAASQPRSAAASTSTLPVGRSTQPIRVGGQVRTLHTYRPAGLSGAVPLVVMLHGGYGSGVQAETSDHWDQQADKGHFIGAFPDGSTRSWNAGGGCCGQAGADHVDDVAFIRAVVKTLRREASIDPTRIYVAGMSNGAIMAYRLACQTHLFAAVASVAGTILADCGHAKRASLIQIHGTADHTVPYHGGPGQVYGRTGARIDGPSVPADNHTWRKIDGCRSPHKTRAGVVKTSVAHCPGHRAVKLISIVGAGHQWPGSAARPALKRRLHADPPSTAIDATSTIWRFFAAHPG